MKNVKIESEKKKVVYNSCPDRLVQRRLKLKREKDRLSRLLRIIRGRGKQL